MRYRGLKAVGAFLENIEEARGLQRVSRIEVSEKFVGSIKIDVAR